MIREMEKIETLLQANSYPGRGIIIGKSEKGNFAVCSYFIMGRSENSRNRIFIKDGQDLIIQPFQIEKVEDPSLILYRPVRRKGSNLILTNGDQTDTIWDFISRGKSFQDALLTREFEPDAPNYTPRISGILQFSSADFTYQMGLLKSCDQKGSGCNRFFYQYQPVCGAGHFLCTYQGDGNPLLPFCGEPRCVFIPEDVDVWFSTLWENLNEQNKISLFVRYIDLRTGEATDRVRNKNEEEGK